MNYIADFILDYIASTNELGYLTSCLNNVIDILDEDILFKYRKRLNWMIDKQILDSDSHHTLLKALLLLSNSKWCDLNLEIINKCMKLFENCIHLLSLNDLLLLYDVSMNRICKQLTSNLFSYLGFPKKSGTCLFDE